MTEVVSSLEQRAEKLNATTLAITLRLDALAIRLRIAHEIPRLSAFFAALVELTTGSKPIVGETLRHLETEAYFFLSILVGDE